MTRERQEIITVKIEDLSNDIMIWHDDSFDYLYPIDVPEEMKRYPERFTKDTWWVCDLEDIEQPSIDIMLDYIAEHCDERLDERSERVDWSSLEKMLQPVFNYWRSKQNNGARARKRKVDFSSLIGKL